MLWLSRSSNAHACCLTGAAAVPAAGENSEEEDALERPSSSTEPSAPIPAPKAAQIGRRRQNVFAKAVEIDENWVAPSYDHNKEEIARLNEYVSKTTLLAHLDEQAKNTVIGAFQKKSYKVGQDIITQASRNPSTRPRIQNNSLVRSCVGSRCRARSEEPRVRLAPALWRRTVQHLWAVPVSLIRTEAL
jgi:hypothetical protein